MTQSPRLPVPTQTLTELGLDAGTWRVLCDSVFPSARTTEGILLAVRYCQARGLDVLKRPVHVVPMWSKAQGQEIETVWPGINEVLVTASRTGQYAGLDAPQFGPDVTRSFQGRARTERGWQDVELTLTYPAWCACTVYRLVGGAPRAFSETVFWEEAYSRAGGASSEVPTAMWLRRPRGQLAKCAKAAALRAAFPEEGTYVAEEMEGKPLEPEAVTVDAPRVDSPAVNAPSMPAGTAKPPIAVPGDSPTPTPDTPSIAPAFRAKIDKLIERAEQAGAWQQAEDYLRTRCQGEDLQFALGELAAAQAAALTAEAA